MATDKVEDANFEGTNSEARSNESKAKLVLDHDALNLAKMGYVQELRRDFSVVSILAAGFSVTNSWFGVSAAMVTGINSGGPVLLVYGIILVALISGLGTGISLAELASAMPNAGGQYYWANQLAPKSYARGLSYLTGWFAYAGAVFTSASVSLSMASAICGMWQLMHPEFTILPWHVVLTYQVFNLSAWFFNTYGKILPAITSASFYCSLVSFFIILVAVPSAAPSHNGAKYISTTFINDTGWEQGGIAFILGLVNTNWPFACLDTACHMAEEVGSPEKAIPIAILGTVVIGFCTAWPFVIAMMASIQKLDTVTATPTLVPILEIFNQVVGTAGAIGLETLIICTGMGCQIACHTWQNRLGWSFARDGGLPGSSYLERVDKRTKIPLIAHNVSCVIAGVIGLLYLGSSAAFNSIVTACLTLLYLSYAIPVICLLVRGRDSLNPGPFWCGKFGIFSNLILLAWTLFTFIMYSFPTAMPVTATGELSTPNRVSRATSDILLGMNYVSAVYGIIGLIMCIDWFARARKSYRGQSSEKLEEIEVKALQIMLEQKS